MKPIREAFEAEYGTAERNPDGNYESESVQETWEIWQLAWQAAQPESEPHPPTRHCMCKDCAPSFESEPTSDQLNQGADALRQAMTMVARGKSYQYAAAKVYEAMLPPASPQNTEVSDKVIDLLETALACGELKYAERALERLKLECSRPTGIDDIQAWIGSGGTLYPTLDSIEMYAQPGETTEPLVRASTLTASRKEAEQYKAENRILQAENDSLNGELDLFRHGFKGSCYACEPVGELNEKLQARVRQLEELHDALKAENSALREYALTVWEEEQLARAWLERNELRRQLAAAKEQVEKWQGVAAEILDEYACSAEYEKQILPTKAHMIDEHIKFYREGIDAAIQGRE